MGKSPSLGSRPLKLRGANRPDESVWRRCKVPQQLTLAGVVAGGGYQSPGLAKCLENPMMVAELILEASQQIAVVPLPYEGACLTAGASSPRELT